MAPSKSFDRKKQEKKVLVLDLDETLVHARHEMFGEDQADLSFTLVENGPNYYVKVRPGVREFLERVSEIFNVVIFTASEKDYADKVIDFLDPKSTLISRRLYGDSGKNIPDGGYVKDLLVLEHDLAKLAIIDNYPHAYRLQKSNGIPIKSWFVDPNDEELASLLPFLEGLVAVEDVRPVIAERFGYYNKGGSTKKKNNAFGNLKCRGPAV
ncbi:hypothetical protein ACHQM5_008892 [Ranunculus cassubicifolius]